MAGNSNSGGPRKGAGRKRTGEKILLAGFSAPWFTPEFQKNKWSELVSHEDPRVSLEAMKYVTNRIFGCPTQSVDSTVRGELALTLAQSLADARKRLDDGD